MRSARVLSSRSPLPSSLVPAAGAHQRGRPHSSRPSGSEAWRRLNPMRRGGCPALTQKGNGAWSGEFKGKSPPGDQGLVHLTTPPLHPSIRPGRAQRPVPWKGQRTTPNVARCDFPLDFFLIYQIYLPRNKLNLEGNPGSGGEPKGGIVWVLIRAPPAHWATWDHCPSLALCLLSN